MQEVGNAYVYNHIIWEITSKQTHTKNGVINDILSLYNNNNSNNRHDTDYLKIIFTCELSTMVLVLVALPGVESPAILIAG